jgi:hypothetical protein
MGLDMENENEMRSSILGNERKDYCTVYELLYDEKQKRNLLKAIMSNPQLPLIACLRPREEICFQYKQHQSGETSGEIQKDQTHRG